jgi:hypothetical protein
MTGRDRIVLMAVFALVVIGGAWMLVVSPERKKAAGLATQVASAHAQLAAAEGTLQNARQAQQQYAASYAAVVSLGKAVPPSDEVPSLIYQLELASNNKRVEFASISTSTSGPGATGATSTGSAAANAAAAPAAFTPMPFTFIFNGSFFDLEHLFNQVDGFIVHGSGGLQVSGRLLTIQSVKLAPKVVGQEAKEASSELSGTITATAYVLPATQGLTGGATPTGPAGATPSPSGASSPPTAPAVAKVTP